METLDWRATSSLGATVRLDAIGVFCVFMALCGMVGCSAQTGGSEALADEPRQQSNDEDQPSVEEQEAEAAADEGADEPNEAASANQGQDEAGTDTDAEPAADSEPADGERRPFVHRVRMPEFPNDMPWLNTAGPLRLSDLKGKFVLLDFWTYCCINCIHILPELKKLERAYPNELVVIGVHSAKFETEKDTDNIKEAILRYEIEHPVVNDADHKIWDMIGIRSWPSMLLVDPEGYAVMLRSGEVEFETLDELLKRALPYYKKRGLLDETAIHFELLAHRQEPTPLRFPGKVLADVQDNRLFISDSNHNRIVITTLEGELVDIIGSGAIGFQDGAYADATFDHPQGVALHNETLYVADTENHALRKVDLADKTVTTIAGIGEQSRNPWPGMDAKDPFSRPAERWVGPPAETALNSPWALWVHEGDLYIAMAGPHQIWKMPLDESEIGPYAGNGREDIVDGPLLPRRPYEPGASSFAQPSGLVADGEWLYVADTEGSSIRAVPFDETKEVRTVVGSSELPGGRLFAFGDVDGDQPYVRFARDELGGLARDELGDLTYEGVQLQHAIGITLHEGQLYIADTYNNKIKQIDAKTGETKTIAGTGEPGADDETGTFDEPAGITYAAGKLYIADTNNHLIRTLDLETGKLSTLEIQGLTPPNPPQVKKKPSFADATQIEVEPLELQTEDGHTTLRAKLVLPEGWKINELAPMAYFVEASGEGPIDASQLSEDLVRVEQPAASIDIRLPVTAETAAGEDSIKVAVNYYYCQADDAGLCKAGSVVWNVPLSISADAAKSVGELSHTIEN